MAGQGGWSRERLVALAEPLLYGHRIPCLIGVVFLTLVLLCLVAALRVDNGYWRALPADHPYLHILQQYQDDFGGSDVVLIALMRRDGREIYDDAFLARLKHVTEAALALPQADRAHVSSLFTGDVRVIERASSGFVGSRVLPPGYKPTAETFARIRDNVIRGGWIGRAVSAGHAGALVIVPLRPPASGERPDYRALGALLEERIRARFADATIDVRITGAPSRVHELAAGSGDTAQHLALGFVLLCVLTMLQMGSVRLALPPLACALAAPAWQLGLSAAVDVAVDPLALAAPVLVLAVALLQGTLFARAWMAEIASGKNGYDASLVAFRRLVPSSALAWLGCIGGLFLLQAVPIAHDRDDATSAALGVLGLVLTQGVLLPVWFSYLKVRDVERFAARQRARAALFAPVRLVLVLLARPAPAAMLFGAAAMLAGWSLWRAQDLRYEGEALSAPELGAASRYNDDARAIDDAFPDASRFVRVIAETDAEACTRHDAMEQIDRFGWTLRNVAGVTSVLSLPETVRHMSAALARGSPRFGVLPRSKYWMAQAITPIATSSGLLNPDCSAMAVLVSTSTRDAALLRRIAGVTSAFNAANAQHWFAQNDGGDALYCADKLERRRAWGRARIDLHDYLARAGVSVRDAGAESRRQAVDRAHARFDSMARACPVNFAFGSGPLAVAAAVDETLPAHVRWPIAAIAVVFALLAWLATRRVGAGACVAVPVWITGVLVQAGLAQTSTLTAATLLLAPYASLFAGACALVVLLVLDAPRDDEQASAQEAMVRLCARPLVFAGAALLLALAPGLGSAIAFHADLARLLGGGLLAGALAALLLCPALYTWLMARDTSGA
jgi:predicted RND superfamily exporter protein